MRSSAAAGAGSSADFPDALPSPTSPAAAPSHPSPGRHYYLAVDRTQFKMRTLLELLGVVADRRGGLPIAICVSSRDELDAVCAAVANLPFVSMSPLVFHTSRQLSCNLLDAFPFVQFSPKSHDAFKYSDQAEAERASILEKFRQETNQWNQTTTKSTDIAESSKPESMGTKLSIIIATDACLPLAVMAEAPLMARVLINYELPTKKVSFIHISVHIFLQEAYLRRMSTCLAADGIVINMVVGGEVATLKALEENSGVLIAEMPIHVSEIL
ncbi:hypothetical protein BAE44_0006559 [Dichanthelium oligosanthes]|uniref:Eukaryotic initiation factor 4A n=1 Tax=Dichanthelium oligosanthes TaxID=888268 RepID=A0A1E5W4Q9_9POAL|nr:hypothetical protein BAE44_0006559 [Dichanthelium oligosanthes]